MSPSATDSFHNFILFYFILFLVMVNKTEGWLRFSSSSERSPGN